MEQSSQDSANPRLVLLFSGKRKSGKDFITDRLQVITSLPYFRVKLRCVCLKITYKKKSKDKNTIVIYDKMIYYCKLQNVNIQST